MESDAKNFEIAYLVSPGVPEDDVVRVVGMITGIIEELHGAVRHIEEPIKRRLAYPIEKQRLAFFGYTTFSIIPSMVGEIQKKLKFIKELLRFLVVEEERERVRPQTFRPLWRPREEATSLPSAPMPRREAEVAPASTEEREAVIEKIDKRLDEILGV